MLPKDRTAIWQQSHPDYAKKYTAQYRIDNPDYVKEWRKKNRARYNELSRKLMKRNYDWNKISKIFRNILL